MNLPKALGISIFGSDYSNLKNPIPSKDINLQYTRFIVENRATSDATKKKDSFGINI